MGLGKELLAYFEPPEEDLQISKGKFDYSTLGENMILLSDESHESILDLSEVVIFGLPGSNESGLIRKYLYSLSNHFPPDSIIDLGTLRKGKTKTDTETGFQDVVTELARRQKTIIIIGGKPEDTLHIYNAYSLLDHPVNICGVDAGIPLSTSEEFPKSHYLNNILLNPENKLFDYSHLGYQIYYASQEAIDLLDKLYFNHIRLGSIRQDIREAEPEFRNADILSFSMSSIRSSDSPSSIDSGPNGLYAEEACQLARFAGLSERLNCLSINDLKVKHPDIKVSTELAAQIAWHFLQGFFHRKKEYPTLEISNFQKFIVNVPQVGHDIHFYKSPRTNRWWIKVPYPGKKTKRSLFIPCSLNDYQAASEGEIPDRWWRNFQRIS